MMLWRKNRGTSAMSGTFHRLQIFGSPSGIGMIIECRRSKLFQPPSSRQHFAMFMHRVAAMCVQCASSHMGLRSVASDDATTCRLKHMDASGMQEPAA